MFLTACSSTIEEIKDIVVEAPQAAGDSETTLNPSNEFRNLLDSKHQELTIQAGEFKEFWVGNAFCLRIGLSNEDNGLKYSFEQLCGKTMMPEGSSFTYLYNSEISAEKLNLGDSSFYIEWDNSQPERIRILGSNLEQRSCDDCQTMPNPVTR